MTEILLRTLYCVTLGLALVLLLRRPARRLFGAGPAFTLWLLPFVLALAPWLPQRLAPAAVLVLPGISVMPHSAAAVAPDAFAFDWAHVVIAVWSLGAALGLLRLGVHYFKLLRGVRVTPAAWSAWLKQAATDIGFDTEHVRMHGAGPAALWALPRALILLPPDFAERFDNIATRELVLRHEWTHVRRDDALWSLVMEIASALLWFHPLAWLARSRFRLDQELACDATSLRNLPQRTASYARALLDSVAVRPAPALIPWLAEPQLKERIAMMMRIPPSAMRRRAGFISIAAVLACGIYVAGGQIPAQAATQPSVAKASPSVDVSYKNRNPPRYPVSAVRAGEQGTVMLDVTVNASGTVTGVRVDQRGTNASAPLQVAAVEAARKWKFNPGRKNGKSVGGTMQIPVHFSLEKDGAGSSSPAPCPAGDVYDVVQSKCVKTPPVSAAL